MKPMLGLLDPVPNATATVWTYLAYLAISLALTIWVARTLHKNGRIFLVDSFLGNEPLADSVNHLLVVGFFLPSFITTSASDPQPQTIQPLRTSAPSVSLSFALRPSRVKRVDGERL